MAILGESGKQEDQVYVVILIVISVVAVLAILGPIGVLAGLVTVIIGMTAGLGHVGSVAVAAGGAVLGMMLVGPKDWLIGPANDMAEVYRVYLFDSFRWDMEGLSAYYTEMLTYGPSWPYFSPLGIFAGGMALTAWNVYGANPLRQTAKGKRTRMDRPSLRFRWTSR